MQLYAFSGFSHLQVIAAKSNIQLPMSLQPNDVNLHYFKL